LGMVAFSYQSTVTEPTVVSTKRIVRQARTPPREWADPAGLGPLGVWFPRFRKLDQSVL
jgi:hypothetical protein